MWYEEAWAFATAEWWRVAVLVASLTILICLCCYLARWVMCFSSNNDDSKKILFFILFRCCYLCWDCCTDPFWGYCPRCDGLESCLKLQCCCRRRGEDMRAYYEIDLQVSTDPPSRLITICKECQKRNKGLSPPSLPACLMITKFRFFLAPKIEKPSVLKQGRKHLPLFLSIMLISPPAFSLRICPSPTSKRKKHLKTYEEMKGSALSFPSFLRVFL